MTAQIHDKVLYEGESYALVGLRGAGFFNVKDFGMTPRASVSFWHRAHTCFYMVHTQQLLLEKLTVSLAVNDEPPLLNGIAATSSKQRATSAGKSKTSTKSDEPDPNSTKKANHLKGLPIVWVYENVNLPIDFTGGLLLGRDFIEELYVHMGFHPAWKYREVHELVFENGVLQSQKDCSQDLKQVRLNLAGKDRPTSNSDDDVKRWIGDCFSLKYTR